MSTGCELHCVLRLGCRGPFVLSRGGGGPDILAPGLHMAAQYDVNLEKCALLKCLCGSAFAARQAPVRSLALKISVIFGHTDKSSLIHLSNL